MKKNNLKLIFISALAAAAFAFSGCGGNGPAAAVSSSSSQQIAGTVENAGEVKALCPSTWKSVGVPDIKASEEGTMLTTGLRFVKGETDLFENTYIELMHYASRDDLPKVDVDTDYDEVVQTGEIAFGSRVWEGYRALSLGKPFYYLETKDEGSLFTAYIYIGPNDDPETILQDPEVGAILASTALTGKE